MTRDAGTPIAMTPYWAPAREGPVATSATGHRHAKAPAKGTGGIPGGGFANVLLGAVTGPPD